MQFRKKPVVIDAVQWFPPGDARHAEEHRVGCEVGKAVIGTITLTLHGASEFYSIKTVSGWVKLEPGDWIITGPTTDKTARDIYPCKQDVFDATYERTGCG